MKSIELKFTLVAAAAALTTACQPDQPKQWTAQQDTAVCVDKQGNRVPDGQCAPQGAYHGGGGGNAFLWYYLGRQSAIPYYGERVGGGSFTRTASATYFHAPVGASMTRSAAVSRGGFGSSAHSFGSFGE